MDCLLYTSDAADDVECKESEYFENMPIKSIIARKSLGVLMHPTCIPGGRVCGTFGRGAKAVSYTHLRAHETV